MWSCGSAAREVRWVKQAATKPSVSTWRTPFRPASGERGVLFEEAERLSHRDEVRLDHLVGDVGSRRPPTARRSTSAARR